MDHDAAIPPASEVPWDSNDNGQDITPFPYPFVFEILERIIALTTDSESLCALSCTSKDCNFEAEKYIWTAIKFDNTISHGIQYVLRNPARGRRVQNLQIHLYDQSQYAIEDYGYKEYLIARIRKCLNTMPNLCRLSVWGESLQWRSVISDFLAKFMYPLPNLIYFRTNLMPNFDGFHHFLRLNPQVTSFSQYLPNEWTDLGPPSPDTLPNLRELTMEIVDHYFILMAKGKPIESIFARVGPTFPIDVIGRIIYSSLRPVKTLGLELTDPYMLSMILSQTPASLNTATHLHLSVVYNGDPARDLMASLERAIPLLASMRCLEHITWSGTIIPTIATRPNEYCCPTLRSVDVSHALLEVEEHRRADDVEPWSA